MQQYFITAFIEFDSCFLILFSVVVVHLARAIESYAHIVCLSSMLANGAWVSVVLSQNDIVIFVM